VDYSHSDETIVESWRKNAAPWTSAVRAQAIESRRLITDQAIIATVLSRAPHSIIDLGCGEGWLIRALAGHNIRMIGIDVVPTLIEDAKAAGGGEFHVASYESIAREFQFHVDLVVCNFTLIGKESVEATFAAAASLLTPGGSFVVQTLHPVVACGAHAYRDGWRDGSWSGFSADFTDPAPWYFRTLGGWVELFSKSNLRLLEMREPLHPVTGHPASVIFVADVMR
jgi:2-polyprenyl-3-methyl-5-hydroxy-6-metoxy-1,4-benzoquinol methylase